GAAREMVGRIILNSSFVGSNLPVNLLPFLVSVPLNPPSACIITWERENNPISAGTSDTPDCKNVTPKVNLGTPVKTSVPIVPITNPIIPDVNPFAIDLEAKLPIILKPNIAIKKYSGELNAKDIFAKGGDKKRRATALNNPPIIDDIVETPIALAAIPF